MTYRVVDLGTKSAGAIDVFRKSGEQHYGQDANGISPAECLGIDVQAKYADGVRAKGYAFQAADLTDLQVLEELPFADYYLAWDFMEHLPSYEQADIILRAALNRSRKGVWLRMPSFEQDETGEAPLKELGLRFAWTKWHGHPCHYRVEHVLETLKVNGRAEPPPFSHKIRTGRLVINDTTDTRVVPEDAPIDTVVYTENLGPKPLAEFDPPLIVQRDFILTRTSDN